MVVPRTTTRSSRGTTPLGGASTASSSVSIYPNARAKVLGTVFRSAPAVSAAETAAMMTQTINPVLSAVAKPWQTRESAAARFRQGRGGSRRHRRQLCPGHIQRKSLMHRLVIIMILQFGVRRYVSDVCQGVAA